MRVKINNLGMNGEGISSPENNELNKVIFVPFAMPNEIVEIEILQEKAKFCNGKLISVESSSIDRIKSPCPYFMKCGGCNLQHIKYEKQLEFKKNLVKDTLLKVGGINHEIVSTQPSKNYGYRNKGVFFLGKNIGMMEYNSHNIIEIDKCLLMNDEINQALAIIKDWIKTYNISTFDFNSYKGLLKYAVIRSVNNQTLICLVTTNEKVKHLDVLYANLQKLGQVGLYLNINNQRNSIILGKQFKYISGIKDISLEEFGIKYNIDIPSFLQVNNEIKRDLYLEVANNINNEIVIDAYAGAGLLSAILSKQAKKVYSVEIVKEASIKAKALTLENKITNIEVINGDCSYIVPKLVGKLNNCCVVLDPSHAGCGEEVINSVKSVNKIIYISCNPIALAKDLRLLINTHNIQLIKPYDMFPQTKHVETLVILTKK